MTSGDFWWAAICLCAAAVPAAAQVDPTPRDLLQMGYMDTVDGRGPLSGYLYYYYNQPHAPAPDETLRIVLAPGYEDSELDFKNALGAKTDLGLGLAGGAFADSYNEIRDGSYLSHESFTGYGMRDSINVYHDFPKLGPAPLFGVLRLETHYATFSRNADTQSNFVLPPPQTEINTRAGLRWGGREPVLMPSLDGEVSLWYENRYRADPGPYGIDDDRTVERDSQLFWARSLLIYTQPSGRVINATLSLGAVLDPDRFSAFRLGGELPMASEFPLSLPGYYYQELSARRYALLGGSYYVPLDGKRDVWAVRFEGGTALVGYAPGMDQPGNSETGVGVGLAYKSRSKVWQILGGVGYGINAIRPGGGGSESFGILVQIDFRKTAIFHPLSPNNGLNQFQDFLKTLF